MISIWSFIAGVCLHLRSFILNDIWHSIFVESVGHVGDVAFRPSVNCVQAALVSDELSDRWREFEWLNNEIKCYLGWHYKHKDTLEEENVMSD